MSDDTTRQPLTTEDVASLPREDWPVPLVPYPHDAEPDSTVGLRRASAAGQRWCAHCQTRLDGVDRSPACGECRTKRRNLTKRGLARQAEESVPELERSLNALHWAMQDVKKAQTDLGAAAMSVMAANLRNTGKDTAVEELLITTKDVILALGALAEVTDEIHNLQ